MMWCVLNTVLYTMMPDTAPDVWAESDKCHWMNEWVNEPSESCWLLLQCVHWALCTFFSWSSCRCWQTMAHRPNPIPHLTPQKLCVAQVLIIFFYIVKWFNIFTEYYFMAVKDPIKLKAQSLQIKFYWSTDMPVLYNDCASFLLQWQSWAVVTGTVWTTETKLFTLWLFIAKGC